MTDENGLYYMRQRYYDTDIKRFINQDILVGSIDNSKSLNRYAYVQGNPVNYNDPFGLNPLDTLKPYANLIHGFLNIAGVLPGPLGYVADLMNAGVYFLEGNYKAAASMLIQSFNTFATGRIIGNLSRGSSKGRLLTSIFLAGTGATGIVSSGDSFLENAVGLVYSIANNKDADTVFAYLSGTICSAAGVYYGVKSFVGGYNMGSYALEGLEQEKLQKLHNTTLVERIFCYNSQCFVAGTLIKTPDGDKNIENISAGDKVYAYDEATGDIAEKEVVRTFEHEVYELYHVVIDGKEIVTTAEHPFYKVDKISENGNGFVCAKDLKPGDQILLLEGNTGTVDKVFKEELDEPIKVYNFEVKDYHTYFVGEQGVLVHNLCKGRSGADDIIQYERLKSQYAAEEIYNADRVGSALKEGRCSVMPKILIVDDERDVVELLRNYFELSGYDVLFAYDGEKALEKMSQKPDVILLDVNMPKLNGLEVCKKIRKFVSCPILFLTANVDDVDKINGFSAGGDDYITKPFSLDELGARVSAHLRRDMRLQKKSDLKFSDDLVIDYSSKAVYFKDTPISFSKTEFDIIELLSTNAGIVFDKERIYDRLWGFDSEGYSMTVVEHIRKIRAKFTEAGCKSYITTVWGCGYKWEN